MTFNFSIKAQSKTRDIHKVLFKRIQSSWRNQKMTSINNLLLFTLVVAFGKVVALVLVDGKIPGKFCFFKKIAWNEVLVWHHSLIKTVTPVVVRFRYAILKFEPTEAYWQSKRYRLTMKHAKLTWRHFAETFFYNRRVFELQSLFYKHYLYSTLHIWTVFTSF